MIFLVGGTRPNFIKLAPLVRACEKFDVEYKMVHTGQHYDSNLSDIFFDELKIRQPDYHLDVGSSTHADQTAKVMQRFEMVCLHDLPDIVVVVGDVNSTMACALVVSKLEGVKLAHVEAGLRSLDRSRPEEVNKIVTDSLSNYLFTTVYYANANLLNEGVPRKNVFQVGDVVLDNLIYNLPKIKKDEREYVLATIHRPHNTDDPEILKSVLTSLLRVAVDIDVIFPIHPRTMRKIHDFGLEEYAKGLYLVEPMGYLQFLTMLVNAHTVITDSGGVQIETTYLGKPCISVMDRTSHLYTIGKGTNTLVDHEGIYNAFKNPRNIEPYRDQYADGKAAERIIKCLIES
ncbi:MAG TPA: UDP-N-acetylglucosamine 2-epimerase (non-hydrolyzing) [Candidatus Glassbacteria bacterium]|nr:UDP-N-acetylglucosamine 2-epimerase (non-hydrolyzing) [Candidatus Glassbacteria bacterium]